MIFRQKETHIKITVFSATEHKGCTYAVKEAFLRELRAQTNCDITEFVLPKDCPVFCTGCKVCFFSDIDRCPHAQYIVPIWDAIESSDLLVFATPTYVFHTTGQMKALLDHFGTRWMAHSPHRAMFSKTAVILSNAIGAGMKRAARDIKDSLDYWGVARTYIAAQGLGETNFADVSEKKRRKLDRKLDRIVQKTVRTGGHAKPSLKVKILFFAMGAAQKMIYRSLRRQGRDSKDYHHWKDNGWLDGQKPWKQEKQPDPGVQA